MTKIQNPLDRCDFKQKFNALWHRAYSAIRFINGKGVEDGEGSVTLTAEDIPDVQPLLTAGENITIEDNVISATGGGSAPVWGNITGTLTNQTDLKDALDGKENAGTSYTKAETDALLTDKADVASVESIEDEIGAVGQAGTIRNDISLVNDRVDSVEDEIGPETTAGTLRYKIKENTNDIISIENEIDIIDGIIASHSTAINGKADKTYVDNELANKADSSALTNHINNTSNPHQVSKAQVGLANVDNTSDLNKPISTATQNALNAKENRLAPGQYQFAFHLTSAAYGGVYRGYWALENADSYNFTIVSWSIWGVTTPPQQYLHVASKTKTCIIFTMDSAAGSYPNYCIEAIVNVS